MARCYSKILSLNYSHIKSIKKMQEIDSCSEKKKQKKNESPPRLTELDLLYLHGEALYCSFGPLKEKKTSDVSKTAGSGSVARHLARCFSLAGKRKTLCFLRVSTRVPVPGRFPDPLLQTNCRQTHIYYIWFVLFPVVKFCTSRQDPSLNEIGYGNGERCRPVVSADVVELGSMENRTYSSEKQALAPCRPLRAAALLHIFFSQCRTLTEVTTKERGKL